MIKNDSFFNSNVSLNLSKGENFLAFIIAFLAILSCSPVIFIGFNAILILIFTSAYFFLFLKNFFERKAYVKLEDLGILIISIILFLYIAIPFREYDRFSLSVIWFLLFATILFLNKIILKKAFYFFSRIIYIVCLCGLLVLILNALGVALPKTVIPREIGGYFTNYFIAVRLSGQDYSFFGINLYRLNGIFAEPGHFGLLLTMVLFFYDKIIKTNMGKVILLTCLLTLSFGSFILLFGILVKNIIIEKKIYLAIIVTIAIGLFFTIIPPEMLQRFFLDKIDGAIDERTSNYFVSVYNNFLNQGDLIIGSGRDILETKGVRNSDYRGFIIRYGYLGIILYIFLFMSIYKGKDLKVQFLGLFYFTIVFLHRSWFVDYFAFLFFLLIFANKFKGEKVFVENN